VACGSDSARSFRQRNSLHQTVAMTKFLTRTRFGRLDAEAARLLNGQGYLLLRGAIPAAWIGPLRDAFEAGALPSEKWPVPRGADWRHSLADLDATGQQVCRLPIMLAATILPGAGRGARTARGRRRATTASGR